MQFDWNFHINFLGPVTQRPFFLVPRDESYENIEKISEMYENEMHQAFNELLLLEINEKVIPTSFKLIPQFDTKVLKLESGLGGAYCTGILILFMFNLTNFVLKIYS